MPWCKVPGLASRSLTIYYGLMRITKVSDDDEVYYESAGVVVTSTHFVTPTQTIDISEATGSEHRRDCYRKGPFILVFMAMMIIVLGPAAGAASGFTIADANAGANAGALFFAVIAAIWYYLSIKHVIVLHTAEGKLDTYSGRAWSESRIDSIISSLFLAIEERINGPWEHW